MGTGRHMAALPCPHPGQGTPEPPPRSSALLHPQLQHRCWGLILPGYPALAVPPPLWGTALLLKNNGRVPNAWDEEHKPFQLLRTWCRTSPGEHTALARRCWTAPAGVPRVTPRGHLRSATGAAPWHSLACPQVPLGLRGWHPAWHGAELAAPGLPARRLRRGPAGSRRLHPVHPEQKHGAGVRKWLQWRSRGRRELEQSLRVPGGPRDT